MTKKDGMSAFPCPVDVLGRDMNAGMSIRDYAAVQFMAAMISTQAGMANISKVARESKVDPKICAASAALEFADALLAARSAT